MSKGGVLTSTASYSCLGWPSLRILPYIRLLQHRDNVTLLAVYRNLSAYFLPHSFPGCLSFPTLSAASLWDTLVEPSILFRVYALYASYLHLLSL